MARGRWVEGMLERGLGELPEDLSKALRAFFIERNLSPRSQLGVVQAVRAWWRETGILPWEADSKTIRDFLARQREGRKESTVRLNYTWLRALVKWRCGGRLPEAWQEVRVRPPRRNNLRDEVLSPEEVKALVRAAGGTMHRAAMAVLYEGALRRGELCSLRMRDLEFTDYGFRVRVQGKTGERTIPLVDSAPYLRAWLQVHPSPGDPDSPLFLSRGGKPLSEDALYKMVVRAAERAGIGRRVHPHTLRHTRLTELAKWVTEQELKLFAGWEPDSRMAAVYVHLSGRDVESSILRKVHGMEAEEVVEEESPLRPQACPNCGYVNPADADFCLRCGHPLTERARREVQEEKERLEELIMAALRRPEAREALVRAVAEALRERGEG